SPPVSTDGRRTTSSITLDRERCWAGEARAGGRAAPGARLSSVVGAARSRVLEVAGRRRRAVSAEIALDEEQLDLRAHALELVIRAVVRRRRLPIEESRVRRTNAPVQTDMIRSARSATSLSHASVAAVAVCAGTTTTCGCGASSYVNVGVIVRPELPSTGS